MALHRALTADGVLYATRDRLVALDYDYEATVYAAADGRELARKRDLGIEPGLWGADWPSPAASMSIDDDQVYVYGVSSVTAFGLGDLRRRWRSQVGLPVDVHDCGALLCVAEPQSLTVLDRATGAVRWRSDRFRSLTGDGLARGRDGTSAFVDPSTGRVVRELGRGGMAGDLLLRADGNRTAVLARDDVLGFLPAVGVAECAAAGAVLTCPGAGRVYTVWRVRAAPGR